MKRKTVAIIDTDGNVTEHDAGTFFADGANVLGKLQVIVGGFIEVIRLGSVDMVVNEEGRLRGLPLNLTASHAAGQPIVGDVALVPAGRL